MKKFRFLPLTVIFVIAVFFASCSDDNGTNNNGDNAADYYKMSVNNYWYYQVDATDKNNNVKAGTTSYDSSVVATSLTYFGKTAFKIIHYLSDNTQDTTHFAVEGDKLYTFTDNLGNASFRIPYGAWVLIGDFNGTKWTVIDTSISTPVEISPNTTVPLTAQIKLTGEKTGKETLTINGASVECMVFTQTATITGKIKAGIDIPISQSIPIKYYFGKKIGLVKETQGGTSIVIPGFTEIEIPGFIQNIIRYNVN